MWYDYSYNLIVSRLDFKKKRIYMLNSEYRFPLFDSILYGPMNPFSTSNSSEAFMLDEKPHLGVEREDDRGVFVLSFLKPFNQSVRSITSG